MQIPGSVWVEVWQNARPVPARRQRRLFDDTKEAEKVVDDDEALVGWPQCLILLACNNVINIDIRGNLLTSYCRHMLVTYWTAYSELITCDEFSV